MYTVEVTLRGTPLTLAVQRKELEDAKTLYRSILNAVQTGTPKLLELTCEKETEKQIGLLITEVSAVQMAEKGGGAAAGRMTGFGALLSS
ncbi:MAG: hypothetical protein MH252_06475 [Thermosynechococcaceae cyanobacterium MS004]|nr:hypothetical protein [Thermosynechococcaceae cyanobacterium MS004]